MNFVYKLFIYFWVAALKKKNREHFHLYLIDEFAGNLNSIHCAVESKIEKVPRGIRGEKSSKDISQ